MQVLVDRIKRNEGLRLVPYLCPAGFVTCGIGCNLEANPKYIRQTGPQWGKVADDVVDGKIKNLTLLNILKAGGFRWTRARAEAILDEQLTELNNYLFVVHLPWAESLDDARKGVLIEMAFQLGIGGLLKFRRMLDAMKVGDFEKAYLEALDSTWAKQTPKRAQRLAEIIRTGVE